MVDVRELAQEVCRRYRGEYPDEEQRYGPAGDAWCVHDNRHILQWALLDPRGLVALTEHVAWLAQVLGGRDFPWTGSARPGALRRRRRGDRQAVGPRHRPAPACGDRGGPCLRGVAA
jgi:hypothetical protein